MKVNETTPRSEPLAAKPEAWLSAVRSQVNSLRFGVVQIVVHDSRVVQIERTEKIRLDQPGED